MKKINLLPKLRQRELHYETFLKSAWFFLGLSVLSIAAVLAVQLGTKFYLSSRAGNLKYEIEELRVQVGRPESAEVKAKIKAANDLASDFKSLADASPKWSKLIKAFAVLPPKGVRVTNLSVDQAQKKVMINGQSPTRELVIQLYNNILNDKKNFRDIDYPLENVAKPTEVSFHFTFFFNDELIK